MLGAGKALALGAATLLFALSAQAGPQRVDTPMNHPSVVVRYADLNLATAAGTQALYARLSSAASRACGGQPGIHELRQQQDYRACYGRAMAKAVKKIDSQRLQALHAERTSTRSVG
jgi:UrcA family protein